MIAAICRSHAVKLVQGTTMHPTLLPFASVSDSKPSLAHGLLLCTSIPEFMFSPAAYWHSFRSHTTCCASFSFCRHLICSQTRLRILRCWMKTEQNHDYRRWGRNAVPAAVETVAVEATIKEEAVVSSRSSSSRSRFGSRSTSVSRSRSSTSIRSDGTNLSSRRGGGGSSRSSGSN